ncbi:hypothetical protein ANCCEY_05781 [Ancylostoma ceylanicum]|uniref:Uncharacterized protein n=1 Tax=Ancylostoma ceylanicum TaxID=53326 RepID=A0A0D6M5C7_9BILA|nr:hypothetical protein ANCCEY_05781 [Ancylostoma ceylanicum]
MCLRKCTVRSQDTSEQSLVAMLEERLNEAESSIQDYRDENTVLKCELRDLQETTYANSDAKLKEKIACTEALCDELMEENELLKTEVRDLQQEIEEMQDLLENSSDTVAVSMRSDTARVKELESELRIAKEVSVRLHNELEQTEAKRYKLEDELFYMKEKVRELQTQNKWREARNKTDVAMVSG